MPYMRDTLRRLLAGEKNRHVLLPENYKPDGEYHSLMPTATA